MSLKMRLRKYRNTLRNSGLKMPATMWLFISLLFGGGAFVLSYFLFAKIIISIIASIAVMDLFIGIPVYLDEKRIADIEQNLPGALREMGDILKSGGTYEYALREVSNLDFGALSPELERVLIRLEEGSNFETALKTLPQNVDSELVKKVIGIIVDSVRAGAGLADVLEDISDDTRKIHKLEKDKKAKTTMQMMFIVAAGALIAPAIFGLVMTIVDFLISVSTQMAISKVADIVIAKGARDTISLALTIYIVVESFASSMMITMMRSNNMSKVIIYFPLFLSVAIVMYYGAMFAAKALLSGMI